MTRRARQACHGLVIAALIGLTAGAADARKYASIVIDAATGETLHEDDADAKVFPASLTKIMTLYMMFDAIERGQLGLRQRLWVSKHAESQPPSEIKLKHRETIAVEDAIKALITKSANDVAVVVAEALGGTESEFAEMMTKRARGLGMARTVFRNASGLPNSRQRTTARDMARLSLALIRDHPHHYHYFSLQNWSYRGVTYRNHNRLLKTYAGMDGIKTGYIRASGFNLAASAVRQGRRLIAVVTGGRTAKSRNAHMARLLDRGFQTPSRGRGLWLVENLPTPEAPQPKPGVATPPVVVAAAAPPPPPQPKPIALVAPLDPNRPLEAQPRAVVMASSAAPARAPQPTAHVTPAAEVREISQSEDALRRAGGPVIISAATALRTGSAPANQWAIQVGAFSRYSAAHLAVTRAAQRLPHLLMNTHIAIVPVERSDRVIYRARLVGLAARDANASCRLLQDEGVPCLPVEPGDPKTLRFARAPA